LLCQCNWTKPPTLSQSRVTNPMRGTRPEDVRAELSLQLLLTLCVSSRAQILMRSCGQRLFLCCYFTFHWESLHVGLKLGLGKQQ
jgi:hypothetical protein